MSVPREKNHFLSKISVGARTAVSPPKKNEVGRYIGLSLSIRARARIALAAAFLAATPILFIGVISTEEVSNHAAKLNEYNDYLRRLLSIHMALKDLDLAIWAYSTEGEFENGQAVLSASLHLKLSIEKIVRNRHRDLDIGGQGSLESLALRIDGLINRSITNRSLIAQARLSIMSMSKELKIIERRVNEIIEKEKIKALGSLSMVGRDQLILFLILLLAIPIFVGFVPGWLVLPLTRLRQIISKIELGQLKDMPITGRDEVAILARNLKSFLLRKDEIDHKKSSKIFEIRNILRSVINRVKEPVFIIDESTKINYTNDAAATLVGLPSHQMEGKTLSDCMYSPTIKKLAEKAFIGDIDDEEVAISVEVADGRTHSMNAKIGMVRNRDGEISRVVIVLHG